MSTASAPDLDRNVLAACQRGDREAFHVLFEKYKDKVYSTALYFSGNEATARDVSQEVFLKLFTRIGQFRGDANFSTWLYRMVANACVDQQRKVRRLVPLAWPVMVGQLAVLAFSTIDTMLVGRAGAADHHAAAPLDARHLLRRQVR